MLKNILCLGLLMISAPLAAQGYTSYFTGDTADVTTNPAFGTVLMGGATENDNAMRWFLNKADGGDVVVIRSSGSDGYNNYFFSELGVTINSVETLVITSVAGAENAYVLQQVANAEAIWFAGGDQFNYVSYFKDTQLENVLNSHINTKQAVIGGTSAGMAILGASYFDAANGTVTSSQALANPYDSRVSIGHDDFLEIPYLTNTITDTHYDDPDRRGRHMAFMARMVTDQGVRAFGIASEEFTSVCIDADGKAYVYGDQPSFDDNAFFVQTNCQVGSFQPENCSSGQPLTWNLSGDALKVYKVPGTNDGTNFLDLNDWQTGSGGTWLDWSVTNGNFSEITSAAPNCSTLSAGSLSLESVALYPNPFSAAIQINGMVADTVEVYSSLGVKGLRLPIRSMLKRHRFLKASIWLECISKVEARL